MGALNLSEWQKLPITLSELCINTTLRCGQSFRWRKSDSGIWSIAIHNRILSLHQDPTHLYFRTHPPPPPPSAKGKPTPNNNKEDDTPDLIKHYFNLSPSLTSLYKSWSLSDPNFAKKAQAFTGVRILRQPAWEALVGFICSSNNNISRISGMVHRLCERYGEFLGEVDGVAYHDFPAAEKLAGEEVEGELRGLGFGYRAKYLQRTARAVVEKEKEEKEQGREKGKGWLEGLRNPEAPAFGLKGEEEGDAGEWRVEGREGYRAAHEALLELQGVGPKVADCVCLMGLGWGEAVPVDTHVWQIAVRDYRFGAGKGGKNATMTKGMYDAVGNKFRGLWGQEAGWAHSVLFTADLKAFSERLVEKKEEVVEVKKEEEDGEEIVKTRKVLKKAVKRVGEEEKKVVEIEERTLRSKRRRRN